jgi:nucleoside-diphosphate-sugar epimerase
MMVTLRVLITGNEGFIGRHLERQLQDRTDLNIEITGIDLKSGNDAELFFKNDDSSPFDLVFHCAALVGGRHTIEYQPLTLATRDLQLDAALFEWAERKKPRRIIYYSSSAAYPMHLQKGVYRLKESDIWIGEELVGTPDTSYGWVKLTGEHLAHWYRKSGGCISVLRPFSGYGSDQDLDYPFPSFAKRARERVNPFPVWGNGTQVRDFIHIDDVAAASILVGLEDIDGPLNLGTGIATDFNSLALQFMNAAGYKGEIVHFEDEPIGAVYRVADTLQFSNFYTPKISLEQGIAEALKV